MLSAISTRNLGSCHQLLVLYQFSFYQELFEPLLHYIMVMVFSFSSSLPWNIDTGVVMLSNVSLVNTDEKYWLNSSQVCSVDVVSVPSFCLRVVGFTLDVDILLMYA